MNSFSFLLNLLKTLNRSKTLFRNELALSAFGNPDLEFPPFLTLNKISRKTILTALYVLIAFAGVFVAQKSIAQIGNIYNSSSDEVASLSSLISAASSDDVDGVRFFSKAGTSVINQKNLGGATALHIASRRGNFEIVTLLLNAGADVNIYDNEGWTPLMRAALSGSDDIVKALIAKGADASSLNLINESAIIHASTSECSDCLATMFENFNFIKTMDVEILKSQINDAFVIARNHEDKTSQEILEKYLDQVIKMQNLVQPSVSEQDMSIVRDNKLNVITKPNFSKKSKSKFKLISGDPSLTSEKNNKDGSDVYVVDQPQIIIPLASTKAPMKKNKFVLITDKNTNVNTSNNSSDKVLETHKFKLNVGEEGKVVQNPEQQATVKATEQVTNIQTNNPPVTHKKFKLKTDISDKNLTAPKQ